MGLLQNITNFFRRKGNEPISVGRTSEINRYKHLSPYRMRTANILKKLRGIREEAEAIDFLRKVTPDVSMAVWNFLRLSNQGHEMSFYSLDKKEKLTNLEDEWREFSARVNEISNAGLDGLIDILHQLAFIRGAQAIEVEVSKDRKSIVDVYPIIPQTIQWEIEERNGRKVWIPYQQQSMKRVSLEKANFFWVPTDPDADDPRGNLILAPVLQSVDFQMQVLQDLAAVLHHQGWPRNDIKIVLERLMSSQPPDVKAGRKSLDKWLKEKWDEIVQAMNNVEPDSDYIHFDDIEITMNQGANQGRSLDVRAIAEVLDVQTISGSKQMGIFMNRASGITESWGTVQFRIFISGIQSVQRGSKRLIEELSRLWLRINGVQAIPVFTYNKVDWNSEEQKATVKLMWQEFWAIAQLMGWVDKDKAAQEGAGVERAAGDPFEGARVTFKGGDKPEKGGDDQGNIVQMRNRNAR